MQPREKHHADGDRSPARQLIATGEVLDQQVNAKQESCQRDDQACYGDQAQRDDGKGGDPGHPQAEQLGPAIFAFAGQPLAGRKRDQLGAEPDPGEQPLHETLPFGQHFQRVDDLAVEQTEIAGVGRDDDRAAGRHQPVIEPLGEAPPERIGAVGLYAADDLAAAAPALQEQLQHRGRMLAVGIHEDDRLAPRRVETGGQRGLLAEIPGKAKIAHPRNALGH